MTAGANYSKRVVLLIFISTLLRLLFAVSTELSADEVYYWTYALKLQWNYFDHPPIVALLIRLTTFNLLLHTALFVRLGAIICAAASTWAMFKLGSLIKNEKAGWFSSLLFTSSIYCSISAGANILPDSPELVFWLFSLVTLIKISRLSENENESVFMWCIFGVLSGLASMCKMHGLFLWFGALLYVLIINRNWLNYKGLYLSAFLSLIIISPLIVWNIQHNFIGYRFHVGRVLPFNAGLSLLSFLKAIVGEAFINNPINIYLIIYSFWLILKEFGYRKKEIKILLFCSLPLIGLILLISFSDKPIHIGQLPLLPVY